MFVSEVGIYSLPVFWDQYTEFEVFVFVSCVIFIGKKPRWLQRSYVDYYKKNNIIFFKCFKP